MKLIFDKTNEPVVQKGVTCPLCGREGDVVEDDIEPYEIWCKSCRHWFELGFQIHSGD